MSSNEIAKDVRYDRECRDWAAYVDGNYVGSRSSYSAAMELANEEAYRMASSNPIVAEPAPVAPVAAVETVPQEVAPVVERAAAKAAWHLAGGLQIRRAGRAYLVPSGTRAGIVHRVQDGRCTCEAGRSGKLCWHRQAVELVSTDELGRAA